ncbi:hypothetical protein EZ428_14055 [Pedobacter frigiditerrae]|uniref:Uncharacterized protein n=1 Tax=Pedobacter frigiditerrae TaxID=2530452 RepID=A0A4R0MTK9_9SPHI|nr:hypothetical protein EZ428_14055 [Pedobacter frigiditerrae]
MTISKIALKIEKTILAVIRYSLILSNLLMLTSLVLRYFNGPISVENYNSPFAIILWYSIIISFCSTFISLPILVIIHFYKINKSINLKIDFILLALLSLSILAIFIISA